MKQILAFTSLLIATSVFALKIQEPEEPKISATVSSKAIAPKSMVKASVVVEFGYQMHGYQNPPAHEGELSLTIKSKPVVPKFKVTYPKGVEIDFAGDKTMAYEGKVVFPIVFEAPAKAGASSITVEVFYQQCNQTACFPPRTVTLKIPFKVVAASSKSPR